MSGALAAMVGSGNKLSISVTVGQSSDAIGNTFGVTTAASNTALMSTGPVRGSLSLSSIKGVSIILATSFSGTKFRLALAGTLARTFIQSITVQETSDAIRYLKQQDASFDTATYSGATLWEWSSVTGWTGTGTRTLLVAY